MPLPNAARKLPFFDARNVRTGTAEAASAGPRSPGAIRVRSGAANSGRPAAFSAPSARALGPA